MRTIHLPNTPLTVSAICYSAAPVGSYLDATATDRLFGQYREAGGNFFDTAHCYCFWIAGGDGASERGLGAWLRRSGARDAVVIATKGGHPAAPPAYPRPEHYLAPETLTADIDDSLQRLGIETIDLYFLHRDDGRTPVGEVIDALNAEIDRGRLRAIGASNWRTARIAEANAYAQAHGLHGFTASQPQWSLATPTWEVTDTEPAMRSLTPADVQWHQETGLPVVAYTSTACGYFADPPRENATFDTPANAARRARARQLAADLGVTSTQVALAYLLCQPFPTIPILGTQHPAHLADALGAAEVALTPAQLAWLVG